MSKPTRKDLIRLVHRIQTASGCIVDLDALISEFERNVPNPDASRLIFDPPSGRKMSAEEVVDAALNESPGKEN